MGKLTQLGFGILRPQHPATNLMTAAMTHASSVACADLLGDLKSGYLLGADPRRQFVAQAIGIVGRQSRGVGAGVLHLDSRRVRAHRERRWPRAAVRQRLRRTSSARSPSCCSMGSPTCIRCNRTLVIDRDDRRPGDRVASNRLAPRQVVRWMPSTAGLGLGLLLPLLLTSLAMLDRRR